MEREKGWRENAALRGVQNFKKGTKKEEKEKKKYTEFFLENHNTHAWQEDKKNLVLCCWIRMIQQPVFLSLVAISQVYFSFKRKSPVQVSIKVTTGVTICLSVYLSSHTAYQITCLFIHLAI